MLGTRDIFDNLPEERIVGEPVFEDVDDFVLAECVVRRVVYGVKTFHFILILIVTKT